MLIKSVLHRPCSVINVHFNSMVHGGAECKLVMSASVCTVAFTHRYDIYIDII